MKYLLALLASPALAISVGDCINRAAAPENDWSYLYKVTVVSDASFTGVHEIYGVTKVLPKRLGFVEVDCPTEEQKQAYKDKLEKFKSSP